MVNPIRLFHVEDDLLWRELIIDCCQKENFLLKSFASHEKFTLHKSNNKKNWIPEVCILDMFLGQGQPTGADIGLEIKEIYNKETPKCMIHSAFPNDTKYLHKAITLKASCFLDKEKEEGSVANLIHYIRVLALCQRLEKEVIKKALKISLQYDNVNKIIISFFEKLCFPLFIECLKRNFVILINDHEKNYYRFSYEENSKKKTIESNPEVAWIEMQKIIFAHNKFEIMNLNNNIFKNIKIFEKFDNIRCLPMQLEQYNISFIFCQEMDSSERNLNNFINILNNFIPNTIRQIFSSVKMTFNTFNSVFVWSRIFMNLSAEHRGLIDAGIRKGEIKEAPSSIQNILAFSDNLRNVGETLWALHQDNIEDYKQEKVNIYQILWKSWDFVIKNASILPNINFSINEDDKENRQIKNDNYCIETRKNHYLDIAFVRIMEWLLKRSMSEEKMENKRIKITIEENRINFYGYGKRIPSNLRKNLFIPFTKQVDFDSPLYITKTIICLHNGGKIEDKSEEEPFGHKITILL